MCPLRAAVIQADRWMDMAKLIGTFCNYTNVPKMIIVGWFVWWEQTNYFKWFQSLPAALPTLHPKPSNQLIATNCLSQNLQGPCDISPAILWISIWFIHQTQLLEEVSSNIETKVSWCVNSAQENHLQMNETGLISDNKRTCKICVLRKTCAKLELN
jgi:hypothetical protein